MKHLYLAASILLSTLFAYQREAGRVQSRMKRLHLSVFILPSTRFPLHSSLSPLPSSSPVDSSRCMTGADISLDILFLKAYFSSTLLMHL